MSWTVNIPANLPAGEAKAKVAEADLPEPIKAYLAAAIDAIVKRTGSPAVLVTVTGSGHLCDGTDYEASDAVISVVRGDHETDIAP